MNKKFKKNVCLIKRKYEKLIGISKLFQNKLLKKKFFLFIFFLFRFFYMLFIFFFFNFYFLVMFSCSNEFCIFVRHFSQNFLIKIFTFGISIHRQIISY